MLPPPLKPNSASQANFQALNAQLGDSCSASILEPERSALIQEALADSHLQAVKAQLERRGLGMNVDEAQAVQLVGGEQLLIPFSQDAHLVWTRTSSQTAAVGLIRQGNKALNVGADGQERVVRFLPQQKVEKLLRKLREKGKFQEFEEKLHQKGKRVGRVRVMLDETNKIAILGIAAEGSEKISHQVRIKVKASKDDEPEDDAEPAIQATACGQASGEAVALGAKMQPLALDPGEGGDVTGSYNGSDICVVTGSSWVCSEPRPLFEIEPRSLYQLRHLYPNQDDLVGLVGPEANMLLAGFGDTIDSIDLQQFYSQALSATSSAQPSPDVLCGLLFSGQYATLCEALIGLINQFLQIPNRDLNNQLDLIMQWLINNPNGDLLQEVTNLYHPSPTNPTLQAYKSFIDALTQFFVRQGESPEQARSSAFRAVADAIRLIYEIYNDNGARTRALLELNSRTNGFGLIAIAQLGQLRGLALPNPSSDPQYRWLRFVPRDNTDLRTLVDFIIGANPYIGDHLRNWNQLNDLLRYYYVMAKQALDNGGLATPAGMEGLEGVARATFLLGMAVRFLSGAPGVPAGTTFEIFKVAENRFGKVVVDFRVKTWITEGGRPIDTRIFGYIEPFLSKSDVDSIVQKLLKASNVLAKVLPGTEHNPYGLNVLVLIIDTAEQGALEALCSAIRARSWTTPVMVISGGRVACTGGSITPTQQQAVCRILGLCSMDPYALDTIRSIGKATFVVHVQP